MIVKAVVLEILLHAERKSNLRWFLGRGKFHLWGIFCDDGCNSFPAQLFDYILIILIIPERG